MVDTDHLAFVRARLDRWAYYQRGPSIGPRGYPSKSACTQMEPATERKRTRDQVTGLDGRRYSVMPSDMARLTPATGNASRTVRQPDEIEWPADVIETSAAIAKLPPDHAHAIRVTWLCAGPKVQRWYVYCKRIGRRVGMTSYDSTVNNALHFLAGAIG